MSIDTRRPGRPVPGAFLGLSFELSSLPQIARYGSRGNFVALLRALGTGILRFGGGTADTRVAFTGAEAQMPTWASFALHASDLYRLRRLASRSGWRILLTVGLAHFEPRRAAREAAAAKRALGPWLAGIELGNEPDAFARHHLRPDPWTAVRYDAEVSVYRRAIAAVAPGLPLAGPDVSGSRIFDRWASAFAVSQRPALLTGHHYPLGCHQRPQPSTTRLLSRSTRAAEQHSLHLYMSVARRYRIPFRLDETGSVSCGGTSGISDTFAATLWAFDYIAHAMAAGAAGINFHGNLSNCHGYAPLCASSAQDLARGYLSARPEWWALSLSRALVGDRPVSAVVSAGAANIDAVALLDSHGALRVAIVDDDPPGSADAALQLRVPSRFRAASALSMTAPSRLVQVWLKLLRAGVFRLQVAPASALLVTIADGV